MKKTLTTLLVIVILYLLTIIGSVHAQDGDDSGYPIETETPAPTEPTQAPTKPTDSPTQAPTQAAITRPVERPVHANPICAGTEVHPDLNVLAIYYGVAYEEMLGYFCESGLGIGEISMALVMIQNYDVELTLSDLLSLRLTERMGWGKIWKNMGLVGINKQTMSQALVIQHNILAGICYNYYQVQI